MASLQTLPSDVTVNANSDEWGGISVACDAWANTIAIPASWGILCEFTDRYDAAARWANLQQPDPMGLSGDVRLL